MRIGKPIFMLVLFAAVLSCACVTGSVTAQEPPADANQKQVLEHVARAKRLREFGYPLLARAQLDKARKLDATSRQVLVEYLRLFRLSEAGQGETIPYVNSLVKLYPDDYEACYEIASWLFLTQEPPLPPNVNKPEELKNGLQRLADEMDVYRELGRYLAKPEGELPKPAQGKPALPMAFLARCARTSPGTADVSYLAARDLDVRGQDFQRWARAEPQKLAAFGEAAMELYALAYPLYLAAGKSNEYSVPASVMIAKLLYHRGQFADARRAIVATELLAPGNMDIADLRLLLAEALQDFELLNEALQALDQAYGDFASKLDLSVARRVQDKAWGFSIWLLYREIMALPAFDRMDAIRLLLKDRPEFLEIYYLDARTSLNFAMQAATEQERVKLLEYTLNALRFCEALGDTIADWHRVKASTLWELGRFKEAGDHYRRVAALDTQDGEAPRYAAAAEGIHSGLFTVTDYNDYRNQLEYGDLREKRKVLQVVVTRSPKFFAAQLMLGKVGFMLADFETAYGAYSAAGKLDPAHVESLDGLAHSCMRSGRYEESLKAFKGVNELQRDFEGALRWEGIMGWVVAGAKLRHQAFRLWLEASNTSTGATEKRKLLEEAVMSEPDFAEALVDLAGLERTQNPRAAETYVARALSTARDDDTRAAALREHGRLYMSQSKFSQSVTKFEAAYGYMKGDGTDLLLVALAWHELGKEADASAALRRLFAECPNSLLLRPTPSTVSQLDLGPVPPGQPRMLSPAYDVGDVLSFRARLEVEGEGGGQAGTARSLEYDLRLEVLEKPAQSGVWRLKLSFSDAPAEFAGLNNVSAELKISPWFGLLAEPDTGIWSEIANPAIQAVTEGFTCGLGDVAVAPPYVWRNDLTMGPPHFGGQAIEGSCLVESLGDSHVVVRRALAGRQLGVGEDHANYSRGLEAQVKCDGAKRALREVEFQILKKELTAERDDVVSSRLYVKLASK